MAGIRSRLNNLGFDAGPVYGIIGPMTKGALRMFQKAHKLKATGEPDSDTTSTLKECHGS